MFQNAIQKSRVAVTNENKNELETGPESCRDTQKDTFREEVAAKLTALRRSSMKTEDKLQICKKGHMHI